MRLGLFAALLTPLVGRAQIFSIANGDISTCSGAIVDSGGEGGPGYSNNENFTSTICPDTPGQGVNLNFIIFNLSLTGPAPADQLTIYDGSSTSDPVIGTYTGNELQNQFILSSPTNPTGCLTLQFTSNANGTGAFAASIVCYTPCLPPTAVASMGEPAPALVCVGETMTFDASASYAAPGFTIAQYDWDFYDSGTASGPVVTHSFSEPGEYIVQLLLTDDNGCVNTNVVDLQVRVGTTPLFTGTVESLSICQGGTVDLSGVATPVTWSAMPNVDFGAGVYLPDDVGQTFSSQLTYNFFPPGSTLTNLGDFLSVCVDMEHSYMGDLVISLTCPSGQSVVLHQQGGAGTFLGGANDTDENNPTPGTCWNYCWSPFSTQGTWVQNSQGGATPNVMPSGTGGTALVPGTYNSVGNMGSLVGCPLNGTWTIAFSDLFGLDNGFLCNWNMTFDPSLYPDLTEFTPVIGYTADSMAWSGPGVVPTPGDPTWSTVTPTVPGSYDYTFTVTDNFGCTYDTTITVTVTNAPVVEAQATLGASCSDPTQLHAEIIAFPPPAFCDYTLIMNDSFGDGWNGGAHLQIVIDGVATSYSMPPGGNSQSVTISVLHGATISLIFTAGTIWNNENSFILNNYNGALVYTSPNGPPSGTLWTGIADCGSALGPLDYHWTPAAGVTAPNAADADAQILVPTEFVITVNIPFQPWCSTTDTILVTPPSFLENDSVVTHVLCNGGDGTIELISTGLGGPWNYLWVDDQGNTVLSTQASDGDTFTGGAGTYTAFVSEGPNGNGCLDTLTATITEPDTLVWITVPSDTLICITGNAVLEASAQGGTGAIQLLWDQGLAGNGPHTVSPGTTTSYSVQAQDANGCVTSAVFAAVNVNLPLAFVPLEPDTECFNVPLTFTATGAAGGNGQYFYDWGNGPQASNTDTFIMPVSGTVCVTMTDGCETPALTSCVPVEILQTPPLVLSADTVLGCAPFTVRFNLLDTTEQAWVLWDFGFGAPEADSTEVIHLYPVAGNFTVGAQVTWPNGCITDTSIATMVRVITVPIADLTWNPNPASILEPVVHFSDLSQPNVVDWQWDFGEYGTSTEQNPEVTFPNEIGGSYPLQLVVTNELGCTDTMRVIVDVLDDFLVFVPNAFSPNAEGPNETFYVVGNDISTEEYHLIVFDRWGHELFNSTDRFEAWDGTSGGELLPQGVYVWKLKIRSLSSNLKRDLIGQVTLIR
ncbi:MAG: PKD domain-containing protein [Flavobacteriales bacterium]